MTDVLRQAVRSCHGGILIRTQCLGARHRAPLLLLLTGTAPAERRGIQLGSIEEPRHLGTVVDLIRQAGRPQH